MSLDPLHEEPMSPWRRARQAAYEAKHGKFDPAENLEAAEVWDALEQEQARLAWISALAGLPAACSPGECANSKDFFSSRT